MTGARFVRCTATAGHRVLRIPGAAALYIPVDVDMAMVKAQVGATGVSAPPAAMPGLLDG